MAIGIATALAHVHLRGLIHKDINPVNILANMAHGKVWLTGLLPRIFSLDHLCRSEHLIGSSHRLHSPLNFCSANPSQRNENFS